MNDCYVISIFSFHLNLSLDILVYEQLVLRLPNYMPENFSISSAHLFALYFYLVHLFTIARHSGHEGWDNVTRDTRDTRDGGGNPGEAS